MVPVGNALGVLSRKFHMQAQRFFREEAIHVVSRIPEKLLQRSRWDFLRRHQGLTSTEVKAIRQGVLVEGMSKRAVLISYGMPPEHRTPILTSNVWIYWINNIRQKKICFDENDKTIKCHEMTPDGLG
ncbi:MAG: hypothetical protein GY797_02740 [Deltaproteobacteria bacterium]|nr:hypothetical protein [Deltaproteobacteria bacterium]